MRVCSNFGPKNQRYYRDHCNDARLAVRESGVDRKVEKDECLVDAGKTAVMTMR